MKMAILILSVRGRVDIEMRCSLLGGGCRERRGM